MTEHEDLINRLRKIAEDYYLGATFLGDEEVSDLLGGAASALEKVTAERDEALKEADLSAQERGRLIEERDEYQQLYGDMADDDRRAREALSCAEARIEKVRGLSRYTVCDPTMTWTAVDAEDLDAVLTEGDEQ